MHDFTLQLCVKLLPKALQIHFAVKMTKALKYKNSTIATVSTFSRSLETVFLPKSNKKRRKRKRSNNLLIRSNKFIYMYNVAALSNA